MDQDDIFSWDKILGLSHRNSLTNTDFNGTKPFS